MWYIVRDETTKKYLIRTRDLQACVARFDLCRADGTYAVMFAKPQHHNQIQSIDTDKIEAARAANVALATGN